MAKRAKKEYTCTVTYTEGYEQRITEAWVELYYNRLRGITKPDVEKEEDEVSTIF